MKAFFFWMLLYGAAYNLTVLIFPNDEITVAAMCIYTAVLIFYYLRKGNTKGQSFVFTKVKALFTLLLFGFFLLNLIYFNGISLSFSLLSALLGAVCEEILFRGFLLSSLRKKGVLASVLLSALTFAAYHLLGGGVLQAVCAFSVGIAFSLYTIKYDSLFFCILAHLLINLTGDAGINTVSALICSAVTVICGYFLFRTKEK